MSVIFYADISEKLISSFWIWHIPDQEPPSLPSSFLLDLESGDNLRFYAYSVQWTVNRIRRGFSFFWFSSCFFFWSGEKASTRRLSKPSHFREKDKQCFMYLFHLSLFFLFFVFPCLRVILFAPYFDVILGKKFLPHKSFSIFIKIGLKIPLQSNSLSLCNMLMWVILDIWDKGWGVAQCWERSLYTTVAWVWFTDLVSRVGWVFRWFSTLLCGVFLRVLPFPPSTKTNILNFNPTWKQWTRRANSWNVHF